jgi:hypothetical protein
MGDLSNTIRVTLALTIPVLTVTEPLAFDILSKKFHGPVISVAKVGLEIEDGKAFRG